MDLLLLRLIYSFIIFYNESYRDELNSAKMTESEETLKSQNEHIWYFTWTFCFSIKQSIQTFSMLWLRIHFWLTFCWWLRWQRICLQYRRPRFIPWVRKTPWRREWLSTPIFLAWKILWTEELGGLQSMEMQWVEHSWMTNIFTFTFHFFSYMQGLVFLSNIWSNKVMMSKRKKKYWKIRKEMSQRDHLIFNSNNNSFQNCLAKYII